LIHYVIAHALDVVDCRFDFNPLLWKAQKRNQRHREGWSTHAKVAAVLTRLSS
jgi:hypothetical protein